jgi:hypothetical protein
MATYGALERYSIGIGDRFGRQGVAQLRAVTLAHEAGVPVTPVWNKSFREHSIIGTTPADTRRAVDDAVRATQWSSPYYVDADHIGLKNVDLFLSSSDFFTIDVADFIGKPAEQSDITSFIDFVKGYRGEVAVPGLRAPFEVTERDLESIVNKYLVPMKEAGKIYRHIRDRKGQSPFITEVSVDEAIAPQTPRELFFILAAIAHEQVPLQTIAPKFTGSFLKGIDYVGSVELFTQEFEEDLYVIDFAVKKFGLPDNLKISVHSGSDKFSLYPIIHQTIGRLQKGIHLKTAGTTWLEELIGLAASGGQGLDIARSVYAQAFDRVDELCGPYEAVINIDRAFLPQPQTVNSWTSAQFAAALRHEPSNPSYNVHLRQLLHVGYKIAAEMGETYLDALHHARETVAECVAENLWKRHIVPLFIGGQ